MARLKLQRLFAVVLGAVVLFLGMLVVNASVVTYPAPAGLGTGTSGRVSSAYQVRVIQGGVTNDSFTYEIPATRNQSFRLNIISFTTFSHDGSVTVEVTKLTGAAITSASVHPTSYGIPVSILSPTKVQFTVPAPLRKMAVIFNNDWKTHPLLIFADPLEVNPPAGPSAGVIYYGPGVHDPGRIRMNSGQTLYLAGGAYVKGWVNESGVNNLKIQGRGILSAEDRPYEGSGLNSKTLGLESSSGGHLVEGVTFIQAKGFSCTLRGNNNLVRNFKIVGSWTPTTDGVNTGANSIVEDSFIQACDDTVKIYDNNTIARRLVIWQMENGGVFQHGWGNQNCTGAHVYDIDILRTEWTTTDRDARGIIASVGMSGTGGNHLFENIRVERGGGRIMSMNDQDATWANVTIRNLTIENWSPVQGRINGPKIHDIYFENFKLNGQFITNAAQANQQILNGAYNITFAVVGQDTNPPVVTITSPTNGASFAFGVAIPVAATVTDNAGMANAQLLVDGVSVESDGSAPYQFTATGLAAGVRVLSVVGTDTGGNRATNSVTITVQPQTDFNPPVVTLTTPTNGASFTFGAVIPVAATVTDDVAVAEAQLRVNGQLNQVDTNPPYEFSLTGLLPGNHLLAVVGRDTSFNSSTSSVTITVLAPPSNNYSNLDFTMSAFHWKPATNPAPPHPDANINFSSATNTPWEWDDSSGDFATVTYEINRATTGGPGGAEVYFFGGFQFHGSVTSLRLSADVSRSTIDSQNVGNFHFALRQGTNLFYTSAGLNNVPGVAGPVVNYDLAGLTTTTLKTNGVNALAGLAWTSQYAGQAINFANGLPIEFGFRSTASLGASATSTLRGPQLDNFRVEITGLSVAAPAPPPLTLAPAGGGQWQLIWNAPGFELQNAPHAAGPWSDIVPPATSPHVISPTNAAGYYRLEWTAP
jgi:hypothetical protein